jgi:heme exporter protein A
MTLLVTAQHLTSIRAGRVLFADLSLQLHGGDVVHVEGPNGAGKSTLLRMLAGLLPAQSGQLTLFPEHCHDDPDYWRRQLLFIGHKAAVKAELTALENLAIQAQLDGAVIADPWQLLETVGLLGLEDIPAQQLSAGQQRRIALARLWTSRAQLWILDEPFTALDVRGIELLQQRFAAHVQGGGAIILTSHQHLSWQPPQLQRIAIHSPTDTGLQYE